MKTKRPLFNIIFFLGIFLFLLASCGKDKPEVCLCDCLCQEDEICYADQCILNESLHSLGGEKVIAPNSFVGVVESNLCIDTLIFFNDTTRELFSQFGLIIEAPEGGIQNVAGSYPTKVSDKEYYLGTAAPLCYLNGEAWFAGTHFIIERDSVWMNLKFYTLNSLPGVYVDSCTVVLYKKK